MVHRRDLDGEVLVFGNQGALWGNAMTWWDHDTGTVWSQPLGEAIFGPGKGQPLDLVASQLTSWETWQEDHSETLALDARGGNSRFDLRHMSIVVDFSAEVGVYPLWALSSPGPANDVVAGVPVAIVLDPTTEDRWSVFHRRVGADVLTFTIVDGGVVDNETGATWDPANGRALSGPLKGEILDTLPGLLRTNPMLALSGLTPHIGRGWLCVSLSMNNIGLVSEKTRPRRQVPAWLLGLVIAGVLFGVGLIVFQALGFGDNPVLGDTAATLRSL